MRRAGTDHRGNAQGSIGPLRTFSSSWPMQIDIHARTNKRAIHTQVLNYYVAVPGGFSYADEIWVPRVRLPCFVKSFGTFGKEVRFEVLNVITSANVITLLAREAHPIDRLKKRGNYCVVIG